MNSNKDTVGLDVAGPTEVPPFPHLVGYQMRRLNEMDGCYIPFPAAPAQSTRKCGAINPEVLIPCRLPGERRQELACIAHGIRLLYTFSNIQINKRFVRCYAIHAGSTHTVNSLQVWVIVFLWCSVELFANLTLACNGMLR